MQIQLDEQTKRWLQLKNKPIYVKTLQVNSCCAPSVQEITTYFGKPKDAQNYTEIKINDVSLFIEKPLSQYETMTLKLSGIGIFKMVTAKLQ